MATNIEQDPTPISSLPETEVLIGFTVPGVQEGRTVRVDLGTATIPILDTDFFNE